jgi:mono/diheme cytochrome c family protein
VGMMKRIYAFTFFVAAVVTLPASIRVHAQASQNQEGAASYAKHCSICHGDQREGNIPGFPPLLDLSRQLTPQQIESLVRTGKGRMPAFPKLSQQEMVSLLRFITASEPSAGESNASASLAEVGRHLFQRNCAFCHGRDAAGGETGPDLTRSKLVLADVNGNQISDVIRNGRPGTKMPAFRLSNEEMRSLAAFIHHEGGSSRPGGRRGVDVRDLQTGDVAAGKAYFNGAGGCAKCHSPTGDLAGIASRFQGLKLEERMLYPDHAKSHVTVTLPTGQQITGLLAYRDEFTIGLRDSNRLYHSWPVRRIQFTVDSPVDAHVDLFRKYTDDDIHNLMAYIQTLR